MNAHTNKFTSFCHNTIVKSLVLTILPLVYGIAFPHAISLEDVNKWKSSLIWISFIAFVVHMIVLVLYGLVENKQKRKLFILPEP